METKKNVLVTVLGCTIRVYNSMVLSVFLYACESWTLNAEAKRREYKLSKTKAIESS
jgi:hypothetical protein